MAGKKSGYYGSRTEEQRLEWGRRMQAAKQAKRDAEDNKVAKAKYKRSAMKTEYKKTTAKGGGPMKTEYKNFYKYAPKGPIQGKTWNEKLLNAGNQVATNMLGSIPGLNMIFGSGDYKVRSNTLATGAVPKFGKGVSSRTTRVKHREYIGDVITSGTANSFQLSQYPINPGQAGTFPWLSTVASQYEEYRIRGLIFEFKTMSSDALNSTNTALGQVIMATQYNVLSAPFANKQQMENYEFAGSVKPSCNMIHPIECQPHETPVSELFIRTGGFTSTSGVYDLRLYDLGTFSIATNGMQGTSVNVGELWVSYDIELFKPKLGGSVLYGDHYQLPAGVQVSGNQFLNTSTSALVPVVRSNLGTTVTNNLITIPSWFTGYIIISFSVNGGSIAVAPPILGGTGSPTQGTQAISMFASDSNSSQWNTGTTGILMLQKTFQVIGGGTINVTSSSTVYPPNVTSGDLFIMGIPFNT